MGRGTLESASKIIPAKYAFAIIPNDGVDLIAPTRGIYIGVTGNLRARTVGGSDITFVALAAGIIHPIQLTRIFLTGTTATDIIGLN